MFFSTYFHPDIYYFLHSTKLRFRLFLFFLLLVLEKVAHSRSSKDMSGQSSTPGLTRKDFWLAPEGVETLSRLGSEESPRSLQENIIDPSHTPRKPQQLIFVVLCIMWLCLEVQG